MSSIWGVIGAMLAAMMTQYLIRKMLESEKEQKESDVKTAKVAKVEAPKREA